jgi:hypothetical protein
LHPLAERQLLGAAVFGAVDNKPKSEGQHVLTGAVDADLVVDGARAAPCVRTKRTRFFG